MTASSTQLGRIGEQMAARFLERAGLTVLDRNWRATGELRGELDIVARQGDTLVFCEVKARRGETDASLEAVTERKLSQLRRLAAAWLAEHAEHAEHLRIDVIGVCWPRSGGRAVITHLEGVGG